MNEKSLIASFIALFAVFVFLAGVSADVDDYSNVHVQVERVSLNVNEPTFVSLEAGETVRVEVWFTSNVYDKDVTVRAELDGNDIDVSSETSEFDVLPNESLRKVLTLELPEELEDELYDDDVTLEIKIDGDDSKLVNDYTLTVKRTPYKMAIKSVSVSQRVEAGENLPINVFLENIGYNDLDDIFVTASIPSLNLRTSDFLGDIVALECDDSDNEFPWDTESLDRFCDEDDEDSVSGRLMLNIPYDVETGIYTLEIEASNDDATSRKVVQIAIENDFDQNVFKSGNSLQIVNPTDKIQGYRVVPEFPASVSKSLVFVSPGATETIIVEPNADGDYSFEVSVFTVKGELVDTMTFSGKAGISSNDNETNPVVILTVILAIIFVVLLIVLIVLIGKKPEKTEEFGESYY